MSLINDALKHAQDAQSSNPPPLPKLPLRPAEPSQPPNSGFSWTWVGVVSALAVIAIFTIWQLNREKPQSTEMVVQARTAPVVAPEPVRETIQPATNQLATAPAPAPAPPKLQAIFFDPTHPSAIVSGQTLFVGDRLGKFHVTAITQTKVTLANAARTIVLSLE
jgi:hypothetical protein